MRETSYHVDNNKQLGGKFRPNHFDPVVLKYKQKAVIDKWSTYHNDLHKNDEVELNATGKH